MYKSMIAAVLTTSTLMLNTADATPNNNGHGRFAVSIPNGTTQHQARSFARDVMGPPATISTPNHDDSWENRSMFYRGPTYIGRY